MPENKTKISIQFQLIIIFSVAFLVYSNTLSNPFVWDDIYLIEKNRWVEDFSNINFAFTKDYLETSISVGSTGYYRPIIVASFFINHLIGGKNPFIYHFTNVIIHSINSVLLCIFLYLLFNNFLLAYISALIFAVHPIHTESVSFIAGRTDVVAMLFYLLTLIFFVRFDNLKCLKQKSCQLSVRNKYSLSLLYIVSLIAATFALLSKEISITIPLIILLIIYYKKDITLKNLFKNNLVLILPYIFLIISFFILKYFILNIAAEHSTDVLPIGARILSMPNVIMLYIYKMFLPLNLITAYNPEIIYNYLHPKFIIPLLIILIIVISNVLKAPKKSLISFSILWFFITIIPVINIIPLFSIYAERYLYIPSISACLIISLFLSQIPIFSSKLKTFSATSLPQSPLERGRGVFMRDKSRITFCLALIIIIPYSYLTLKRNIVWGNETTLFQDSIVKSKNNVRAYANLFLSYIYNHNYREAYKTYQDIKKLDNTYKDTFSTLAMKLFNTGYETEAFDIAKILQESNPDDIVAINTSALLYLNKGFYEKAHDLFMKSLELNPNDAETLYYIGYIYYKQEDYISSAKYVQKSLNLNHSFPRSLNLMGLIYEKNKTYDEAENYLLQATKVSNYNPSYVINLLDFYLRRKEYKKIKDFGESTRDKKLLKDKRFLWILGSACLYDNKLDSALSYFKKSLWIDKNNAGTYFNIAFIYDTMEDYKNAMIYYNKALAINPDDINILNNLAILYAKTNQKMKAKELWQKALNINPNDQEIIHNFNRLKSNE